MGDAKAIAEAIIAALRSGAIILTPASETSIAYAAANAVLFDYGKGKTDYERARKITMDSLCGISIGGSAKPRKVVGLVRFLAAPRGAFINRAEYVIDGEIAPIV
jgi:hypothetical protein